MPDHQVINNRTHPITGKKGLKSETGLSFQRRPVELL
jgi:hypothetical protein